MTRVLRKCRDQMWEIGFAVTAFVVMCVSALWHKVQLLEPDDEAYRGAIKALSKFHIQLTQSQYESIGRPRQWIQTANGHYVSEKNPGYAFLAVVFEWLHIIRVTPLFCGAIGCVGLYLGARKWLGRWAGTVAVALFCLSGASIAFAWRAYMPTFTEAALIAAAAGFLVWSLLATQTSDRVRTGVGVSGFVCLEAAVFSRYTNGVVLLVALGVLLATRWMPEVPRYFRRACLASVAVLGVIVLAFNKAVYGGFTKTGYSGVGNSGGQSASDTAAQAFSVQSIWPNIENMTGRLTRAMPMLLLAVVAFVWIVVRYLRSGAAGTDSATASSTSRDMAIGGFLALSWLAVWGLYSMFEWTVQMGSQPGGDVHVIRFYVPVLGLVALLATWLVMRVVTVTPRRWLALPVAVVCALALVGVATGSSLITDTRAPGGPGGGPGGQVGPGGPGGPGGQGGPPGMPTGPGGGPGGGPPPTSP